ncbi:MAG: hypothetical protein NTU53_22060 [Planctomycetota bacterium]|nr:hypothetical protein [Planctomycetota bacterium]
MVKLVEDARAAIDEVIDVTGRAVIEASAPGLRPGVRGLALGGPLENGAACRLEARVATASCSSSLVMRCSRDAL